MQVMPRFSTSLTNARGSISQSNVTFPTITPWRYINSKVDEARSPSRSSINIRSKSTKCRYVSFRRRTLSKWLRWCSDYRGNGRVVQRTAIYLGEQVSKERASNTNSMRVSAFHARGPLRGTWHHTEHMRRKINHWLADNAAFIACFLLTF